MAVITFEDKVALREVLVPRKNAITAEDINEIKDSVNTLYNNPPGVTTLYSGDSALPENRNVDLANFLLRFFGGKVVFGDDLSLPYFLQINAASESTNGLIVVSSGMVAFVGSDATGVGLRGSTTSGVGVHAIASSTGTALKAKSSSGLSTHSVGKLLVEPTDTGANEASAIFEVNSTTLGSLPAPRMNQTQINALSLLDTGLLVFNTTRNRYEHWDGSRFVGMRRIIMNIQHGSWSPTNGQTVAFGQAINAPTVSTNIWFEITMSGNGVITGCYLNMLVGGTVGTNEAWPLYVRHNDTDYLVDAVSSIAVVRKWASTSLNIPYSDGDIVRMIYVNPSTGTRPTSVSAAGHLILQ